jgi:hypothetical protein
LGNLPIPVYVHDYEVDIGVPEHVQARRLPHLIFERSFPKFIDDLRSVIAASGGIFTTTQNHTSFRAAVDSGGDLWIEREQRTGSVRNEELYELWTLLLRGPVTRRKLAGRCREDAYYIFPILRALPYMRIIETQPRNSQIPAYAAELVEDAPIRQTIAASEAQGEFAWP